MKTLREILLERHAPANEKLDAIRQQAVQTAAGMNRRAAPVREFGFGAAMVHALRSTLGRIISIFSQPSPRAWAALAGVWVMILAVNFCLRDATKAVGHESLPPSPQAMAVLQQQKRLLAELIGQSSAPEAGPQKPFLPRPRSERRIELRMT